MSPGVRARIVAPLAVARRHPRHVVLFGALAGLLVGQQAPLVILAAAGVLGAIAGRPPVAVAAVVAVLAGAALGQARVDASGPGALPLLTGRTIEARAILLEPIRHRRNGSAAARVRLLGRVRLAPGGPAPAPTTAAVAGEVVVARATDGRVPAGARVGSQLRLHGSVAPLGRTDDFQRRRGAHAALDVVAWASDGRARGGAAGALDAVRERAVRGLGSGLAPAQAALLRGMVIGQDEAIAESTRTAFQRAGLAHLLAVSGQNVLLLCALVMALAAGTGLPLRARLAVAIGLVAAYVPLAGGGPSIQRAGVMGIAGLVAALAGRPASRWYALGFAGVVTLVVNPHVAGEPGWQLSFAAVAGLLVMTPALRERLVRRRVPGLLAEATAMTIAATLATAPLLALHFEQVSLASLPANLLAAPVVAPVMWLGMLSMGLAQAAPALATPLNVVCAPLLGYLEWVARVAADAPLSVLDVRLRGPLELAGAYAALAATVWAGRHSARRLADRTDRSRTKAAVPGRGAARDPAGGLWGQARPGRHARARLALMLAVAGSAAVAMVIVVARPHGGVRPLEGELVVSFLDVGQGDATLLQRRGLAVLVDTGPPGGPILRRLAEAGVDRLDLLVLTHAETDHEGMALPVIAAHRPRMVLNGGAGWPSPVQRGLAAALERNGSGRVVPAHAGQALRLGSLRMRVLWPPPARPGWRPDGNPNDHAVVAVVRDGAFDLLLPADAESNVTAGLELPRVEALKVAHHGSADEGLPALLERTAPAVAAIEVGRRNTYGHPTPSTLAALRVVPQLVRTDQDGTVRLHVRGDRMRLEREGFRDRL